MTRPKVLISDKMDPNAAKIFEERGCDVDVITGETPEQLIARIGEYDGLAIRSSTKVTKAILDAATNLKVIGRAGIGVDNVDIPAATSKGIVVMNTPFGNSITTAEHAVAMMFALARQIPAADASTQAGKWEKNRFMGVEITGKTLGIIGCGNMGGAMLTGWLAAGDDPARFAVLDPALAAAPGASPQAQRGQYLVEGPGHCGECHTPRNALGGFLAGQWLAGGPNPEGEGSIPNITPGSRSMGSWSEGDIVTYLESGFTPDYDSVGGSMVEVQKNMAELPAADREAIAAYLKAIPAVQ